MADRLISLIKKHAGLAILLAVIAVAVLAYQRGMLTENMGRTMRERLEPFVTRIFSLYREAILLQRDNVAGRIKKAPSAEKEEGGQGQIDRPGTDTTRSTIAREKTSRAPVESEKPIIRSIGDRYRNLKLTLAGEDETLPASRPGDIVYHGSRDYMKIALTFDAGNTGGNSAYYNRLVDYLSDMRVPATFFLTGEFIEMHPDISAKIAATPLFEIGNHSHSHPNLSKQKADSVKAEIGRVQDSLLRLTGYHAVLFRPPYGEFNDTVVGIARSLGMILVMWDVSPQDYQNLPGGQIARVVLDGATNGSIVLMHMRGDSTGTIEALPAIVDGLRARGYVLTTVTGLLRGGQPRARILPVTAARGTGADTLRYE
ncbi:MAG: polysaccharide deacetylase family protein [Spirochaetes bacterium]|nr:MAG: polysaccharide deacetylase family protein [Spirochaetota bacterium]